MKTATFIRHAESTGNAGFATRNLALIELTEQGKKDAAALAGLWTEPPDLIIVSPYLRAKLTAQPTSARFPNVPIEEWAIHEFTYLEPSRWNGTSRATRLPAIEAFWKAADPSYRDGPGAESFSDLLRRAEGALDCLKRLPLESRVLVFTHGQFMQAVRLTILFPDDTDKAKMARFCEFNQQNPLKNCAMFSIEQDHDKETVSAAESGTIGVTNRAEPAPNPAGQVADTSLSAAKDGRTGVTNRAEPAPPAGQVADEAIIPPSAKSDALF